MDDAARIDGLLENAAWVQRLARQMLADQGEAEDVVQETWLAALRQESSEQPTRPWLARVVRNFALQRRRSEGARHAREQSVARPERLPPASETVARAELHARLVQAILELDEPFRSTILWRYFDDLPPEEIARRAGTELATVRSRIARARERLRERLTSADGEPPERWLSALLPFAMRPPSPLVATTGAAAASIWLGTLTMSLKLTAACALTALAALVLWWQWPRADDTDVVGLVNAGKPVETPISVDAPADPSEGSAREQLVDVAPLAEKATASSAVAPPSTLHGIVLSASGRSPLQSARVSHRTGLELDAKEQGQPIESTTDATGRFEIAAPIAADVGLWFEREDHFPTKIAAAEVPRDPAAEIEVVLAPLGRIELTLLDDLDQPIPDAPISYSIDLADSSLDHMWAYRRSFQAGITDAAGRCVIERLPCGMSITLYQCGPMEYDRSLGHLAIDVDTRRAVHEARLPRSAGIEGRVVDSDGRPLANSVVRWCPYPLGYGDPTGTRCDEHGHFVLAGIKAGKGQVRCAAKGIEPLELSLTPGKVAQVGDLVVPALLPLSGRIVASIGQIDGSIDARVFRKGRQVEELRLEHGAFSSSMTPGELEILVTRGGSWDEYTMNPRDVLARMVLPEPTTNLQMRVGEGLGAIQASLGEAPLAEGESITWTVYLVGADEAGQGLEYVGHSQGPAPVDGHLLTAPLAPGRYRLEVSIPSHGTVLTGVLDVASGSVTDAGVLQFGRGKLAGRVVDAAGRGIARASVTVHNRRDPSERWTDEQGRFQFDDLDPGTYRIDASEAEHGTVRRDQVGVASISTTEITLLLGGWVTVGGTVRSSEGPATGLPIKVQPSGSNDTYATSTDSEGKFAFERLPSGFLRIWSERRFLEVVDAAPGQTHEIEVELGSARSLRFLRDGIPLEGARYAQAIEFDAASIARSRWHLGHAEGDHIEIEVPNGPTLFVINSELGGASRNYVALSNAPTNEIELSGGELRIETEGAWHGPLPHATLASLQGLQVISMWAGPVVLPVELDAEGRARIPCLPAGAVVRLRLGAVDLTVETGSAPVTKVRWP